MNQPAGDIFTEGEKTNLLFPIYYHVQHDKSDKDIALGTLHGVLRQAPRVQRP